MQLHKQTCINYVGHASKLCSYVNAMQLQSLINMEELQASYASTVYAYYYYGPYEQLCCHAATESTNQPVEQAYTLCSTASICSYAAI